MPNHRDAVERALSELGKEAQGGTVELDESFYIELRNYSRHEKVKDLDDDRLQKVIRGLGRKAMKRASGPRIGGGHVRRVTFELCGDPFGDCSAAAEQVLREDEESESTASATEAGF